jgi:hypothetical protein
MDHAGAWWKGQDVGAAGMAAGQGIDLTPAACSKLTPSPDGER